MRRLLVLMSLLSFVVWYPMSTGCGPSTSKEKVSEVSSGEQVSEAAVEKAEEPTTTPDEPASTPDEPASTPDEPASAPDEPASAPDEPASTPDEPATTPDEPASTPEDGGSVVETKPEAPGEPAKEARPEGGTTETVQDGGAGEPVPETKPETVIEFNGKGPDPNAAGQITSVRAGNKGKVGQVAVTYLKKKQGSDSAGFFVQATGVGPALFVAVDPASTTPALKIGDIVTFEVTAVTTDAAGQKRVEVTGIKDLKVVQSGYDVTQLGQDVTTKNDIVSALDNYADELIRLEGKVVSGFTPAGTGFVAAQIETKGVPAANSKDLKFRLPTVSGATQNLSDLLGLVQGCEFSTTWIPMWRFRTTAQPSAFAASEITIKSCPAPKLVKAQSTSTTEVVLTFDRPLDKSTINANGSGFLFDNGLSATKAVVNVNVVTVTTSTQDSSKTYKVTASAAIKDNLGKVLDSSGLTATFRGYNQPAVLMINEFNAKISGGCDRVELRVKSGGSMNGIILYNKDSKAVTFTSFVVKKNDIIVVHFDAGDVKCYNQTGQTNETKSANEVPTSTYATNYDTAYDWYTRNSGFATTTGVLSLRDSSGKYMDAVMYTNTTSTTSSSSLRSGKDLITAKQWKSAKTAASFADADYKAEAANHSASESTLTGKSMQRSSNTDTNSKADWTAAKSTLGKKNVGQTDF